MKRLPKPVYSTNYGEYNILSGKHQTADFMSSKAGSTSSEIPIGHPNHNVQATDSMFNPKNNNTNQKQHRHHISGEHSLMHNKNTA